MNPANTQETIKVSALNVGMLIHLDGGWMSHPFPRSSFKISSPDQIATLRSLGLERVRSGPSDSHEDTPHEPTPPAVTVERRGSSADRRQRRQAKASPAPSLNGGERQFSESAKASRLVFCDLTVQPAEWRLIAEGLTRGLVDKMMGVYPAGSVVQLTDDRFALVVGVNSSRTLRPRVLVHDPQVPRDEALIVDLETISGLGIRRSLKPLALPEAALGYLSPRPRVNYFFEPALALEALQ